MRGVASYLIVVLLLTSAPPDMVANAVVAGAPDGVGRAAPLGRQSLPDSVVVGDDVDPERAYPLAKRGEVPGQEGCEAACRLGMRLVDPNPCNLKGQIIYLDFDGEEGVTYNGSVSVGPFHVPAYRAPAELAGQEDVIASLILRELNQIFVGTGVGFAARPPKGAGPYSTVYIGGDDSAFARYGSFFGLAEQVDVGNRDKSDNAFVFSDRIVAETADPKRDAARLAGLIAHEVGHLLGYEHDASCVTERGPLGRCASSTIVNHNCTDICQIPQSAVLAAKANLHIAYGHTSHGSQLITGMTGLVGFANNGGLGLAHPDDIFAFNNGGADGALDLRDTPFSGANDLGNPDRVAWAAATRTYLADHPDVNVIIWSWCGQAATSIANIDIYLDLMDGLIADYPGVHFVFMTGHLDGTGESGLLNLANEHIRAHCAQADCILYDFADIESYDPDGCGNYMEMLGNDNCDYDSDDDGSRDRNWAIDWQNSHTEDVDWYTCASAHSQPLNANRKAYAAWWLWARLAGWDGNSNRLPVYRFWSPLHSRHFYTMSETEKDYVQATYPNSVWTYETEAFYAFADANEPGVAPVYRFWSPLNSAHFYTMDEDERDSVIAMYPLSVWTYEGIAFYAYPEASKPDDASPVYRFWSPQNSGHFYTMDEAEKDSIIADYPPEVWTYESIAWYAFGP